MSANAAAEEQKSGVAGELQRCNILGVGVHAINMDLAVDTLERAVESREKGYVCVTGVHGIMEAQRDHSLRSTLNRSLLTTPDGMPTVWVGRWYGQSHMDRVYGPDMMLEVCRRSVAKGYTHFFYGGNTGVAEELKSSLTEKFPGLRVVGTYTPPFRPLNDRERSDLQATVAQCRPDFFWVGLSTPKQERFMAEYLPLLDATVMCGVGAAFDVHTGRIQDSPRWVKRSGLQWAHRLFQEPRRLGRRYLVNNPKFMFAITSQILGFRRTPV
ncbi:MAG TPA: WecB/TagA/CpsF family glycosyltransferase [Candidatus Koribacter sp.]|jgi:N-acetylglucosaminyldiphosphoundecaprenol N-acetyl-beta-D-mannosaminyltransferase